MPGKRKLVFFGTRHYKERNFPSEIKAALELVIDRRKPQIVLEEWSESQKIYRSGADILSQSKNVPWKSIGTPARAEFETYSFTESLDFPDSANVARYGPVLNQERRETAMCQNIIREMSTFEMGVVVIGIAHLHSMFKKLSDDFEVDAFAYGPELI